MTAQPETVELLHSNAQLLLHANGTKESALPQDCEESQMTCMD